MKKWYKLLIISFIVFAGLGIFILVNPNGIIFEIILSNREDLVPGFGESIGSAHLSMFYAMLSILFELFAILIGFLEIKKNNLLTFALIISSIFMTIWSILMYMTPSHISLHEVILAWWTYIGLVIFISYFRIREIEQIVERKGMENVLDDNW